MTEQLCTRCGKAESPDRAGSITSYFFEHKYCQCERRKQQDLRLSKSATVPGKSGRICLACGKSRPQEQKAGSFTSFLFKELRCHCSVPKFAAAENKRTQVADRIKQKRQTARSRIQSFGQSGPIPIGPGTIIGGTFKIASTIGEGGMGTVYLAQHRILPQKFALKILAQSLVSEKYWQRFQAEAKTLAALKHPNLVQVFDLGIHENSVFYYSMDYLEGRNLEDILAKDGPPTLERTIEIFLAVLDGLAYAHRNGIVHRDIKPANIFICNKGTSSSEVKILDFGIAKLVKGDKAGQELTAVGEIFGSPYYMSPEQCMGNAVDSRSDIYSVGCSLFETLTGFVPFEADSSLAIALMHQENEPPLLSDVASVELPTSVDTVISKCMAKLPRDRYQSAKELALDLERIRDGKEVAAYRTAEVQEAQGSVEEHDDNLTRRWLIPVTMVLLLLGGYALWIVVYPPARPEAERIAKIKPVSLLFDKRVILDQDSIIDSQTDSTFVVAEQQQNRIQQFLIERKTPYSHFSPDRKFLIFDFPADINLGKVIFKNPAKTQFLSVKAQGQVKVPTNISSRFEASDYTKAYPDLIKFFRPEDFTSLAFRNANVKNDRLGPNLVRLNLTKQLDLNYSAIDDSDLRWLDEMKSLTSFNLRFTKITGEAFGKSKVFSHLNSFDINGMSNTTAVLEKIPPQRRLKFVDIGHSKLTAKDFDLLSKLSNLENLTIDNFKLNDENLALLTKNQSLKGLNLSGCEGMTKTSLAYLKNLKSLLTLRLPPAFSPEEIAALRKALPKTKIFEG